MDSKIIAAIIAGVVSLIISGVAGVYSILRNNKKFEELKKELILKSNVENFVSSRVKFLDKYREFERELNRINVNNPQDGTLAVQYIIDFYSSCGRDFYLRNKEFIDSKKLQAMYHRISKTIEEGNLNSPNNDKAKGQFGNDLFSYLSELNSQTLKGN